MIFDDALKYYSKGYSIQLNPEKAKRHCLPESEAWEAIQPDWCMQVIGASFNTSSKDSEEK